jgi:Protein of unknown function (DUF551)
MEWISVKDKLPQEYDIYYLVLSDSGCRECYTQEEHTHTLAYKQFRYGVARYSKANMHIVNWYREKGDNSWDCYAKDRFTECNLLDNEITHWMSFDNYPENPYENEKNEL